MKKLVLFALFAFVFCCVSAAYAYPTGEWSVYLKANYLGSTGYSSFTCGTGTPPDIVIDDPLSASIPALGEEMGVRLITLDIRSPLTPGESTVWNPILSGTSSSSTTIVLSGMRSVSVQDLDISLWLNGAKLWDIDASSSFSTTLPYYYGMNPYDIEVRAGAVPEPGSMCGLLAGLMGMGAYLYRRRR